MTPMPQLEEYFNDFRNPAILIESLWFAEG
jgi:hypothetical protein